jgi:hypothetical protein
MRLPYLAGASIAPQNLKAILYHNREKFYEDPSEDELHFEEKLNRVCAATKSFGDLDIVALTIWIGDHGEYLAQHKWASRDWEEKSLDIAGSRKKHVPWQAEWVDMLAETAREERDLVVVCHTEEFKEQFLDTTTYTSDAACKKADFDPCYLLPPPERAYNIRDWERRILYNFVNDILHPMRASLVIRYVDVHGGSPLGSWFLQPSWYQGTARHYKDTTLFKT